MSSFESTTHNDTFECPVCFDSIGEKNSCITTCGHKFCLNCLLQSYNTLNNCPLCRETLNVNKKPEDDEDNDYAEDDYDDEDDDDEDDDDDESVTLEDSENDEDDYDDDSSEIDTDETTDITKLANIDNITNELKKNGFTMEDLVSMYLDRPFIKDTPSYSVDDKLMSFELDMQYQIRRTLLDKIIDDLDYNAKREYEENALMSIEDTLIDNTCQSCMNLLAHLPFHLIDDSYDISLT